MKGFRAWLEHNGFDPADSEYNFGYHQVGQVNMQTSFGTTDPEQIWNIVGRHLDIYSIETAEASAVYNYTWTDQDYYQQQIDRLRPGYDYSSRG
jgi:hypothetical protein